MRPLKRGRVFRRNLQRSRLAQASAVAVIFLILIFVAALNTYLITTIPQQMSANEFQHDLAVQNAFVQLKSDVLAEADQPNLHVALTTPVPLSSDGVPPFGSPSSSVITANPEGGSTSTFRYEVGTGTTKDLKWNPPAPPDCTVSGNAISCSNSKAGEEIWDNDSGNHTTLSLDITGCSGSGCTALFYAWGSNDTISITATGPSLSSVLVIVQGNFDHVGFNWTGPAASPTSNVAFWIYGIEDTFYDVPDASSGSHPAFPVAVTFIGWNNQTTCPYVNDSATDRYLGYSYTGQPTLFQNITWWNDVGYNTTFHQLHPASLVYEGFQNWSGTTGCAFTSFSGTSYDTSAISGIYDQLYNHYYPDYTVSLEEGAVAEGTSAYDSTMIAPPILNISKTSSGSVVDLTLLQFVQSGTTEVSGLGVTGIQTSLISEDEISYVNGPGAGTGGTASLQTPFYLNVTTLFPGAWLTYVNQTLSSVSSGATATYSPTHGLATYTVEIPFEAVGFSLKVITASVSLG